MLFWVWSSPFPVLTLQALVLNNKSVIWATLVWCESHLALRICLLKLVARSFVPCGFRWSPLAFKCSSRIFLWEITSNMFCLASLLTILFSSLIFRLRSESFLVKNKDIVTLVFGDCRWIDFASLMVFSAISWDSSRFMLLVPTWTSLI